MHIVITTQCFAPDVGGIENLMTGLATGLADRGHQVLVLADRRRGIGAKDSNFPFTIQRFGGPRPWRRRRKARYLNRLLQHGEVLHVIADTWKSLELLPRYTGVRVLCLAHGMELPLAPSSRKRRRIRRALTGSRVIANSRYTARRAAPYLEDVPVTVIPPGVAPPPRPAPGIGARVRQALDGRQPRLISVARLQSHKGMDQVIWALPGLIRLFPQLVYIILGEGPDRDRLRRLTTELGVGNHVIFVGAADAEQRTAWLEAGDVFVLPGRPAGDRIEGFGIAFMEAAWLGLPAIAGRDGGGGEAVVQRETGLVCDGADADAVFDALHELLSNEDLRRRLGAAAAQRAREFSWDRVVQQYEELLY
jgi:phosphatidylinositol alpha-1,6-mannosyltransferase